MGSHATESSVAALLVPGYRIGTTSPQRTRRPGECFLSGKGLVMHTLGLVCNPQHHM